MTAQNFVRHRIGVDVGGTNTDAALLSLDPIKVIASHKTPTTPDVTTGITNAIREVITNSQVPLESIECVIIGTTHFVNAIVQRSKHLRRVAVVRLSGGRSFGSSCPPYVDFPLDLRAHLESKSFFCQGGFQIDGSEITPVDEEEIIKVSQSIAENDIKDVVISGIYAPVDSSQEKHVAKLLEQRLSTVGHSVRITLSHTISSLGFLARENASILNASLRPLAEKTIYGFQQAIKDIFAGYPCALYLTQNDGSVLTAKDAMKVPIRTFNSGPTNSIRGGAFLWDAALVETKGSADQKGLKSGNENRDALIVLDIGGTTSDAGLLLPNGLPRMSSVMSNIAGVRTNFGLPAVESIGLGGGSIVQTSDDGSVVVGPESVGFEIRKKAKVFGGDILTSSDIAVATAQGSSKLDTLSIGNPLLVANLPPAIIEGAKKCIKEMLEELIDRAKIQGGNIDVLIVGGGAVIVDLDTPLKGVRECRTVKGGEVANAVGAAISSVQGVADMVINISNTTMGEASKKVQAIAVSTAIENGAKQSSVEIAEITILPVTYVQSQARIIVKAIGELDAAKINSDDTLADGYVVEEESEPRNASESTNNSSGIAHKVAHNISFQDYKPHIEGDEWKISITDLDFIAVGAKILGCGGGGDPYIQYLKTKTILKNSPGCVRIVDPYRLKDSAVVGWTGNMGSPEVSQERMEGDETKLAQIELMKFMNLSKVDAMIALEIGGANGLVNFSVASDFGIPVVDGDYMGRAYPTYWQTTPNVFGSPKGEALMPSALASGDGSFMIMSGTKTDKLADKALRAACVEMGSRAGKAVKPQSGKQVQEQAVVNTVSLAWRIGRAVKMEKNISDIAERIIEQVGGHESAKILFEGKVISVERTLRTGHTYGILEIEGKRPSHAADQAICRIPFKNENAYAEVETKDGSKEVLASVPDLIAVLDAETGFGLGVPEYKYGLRVIVIAISASPRWTSTTRGLELGGPGSMGFDEVEYRPVGTYSCPRSVIEEYGQRTA